MSALLLAYPEDKVTGDLRVVEYWAVPPAPAGGGWSPALAVFAGLVGVLMWGGLLLVALRIYGATSGVVHEGVSAVGLML